MMRHDGPVAAELGRLDAAKRPQVAHLAKGQRRRRRAGTRARTRAAPGRRGLWPRHEATRTPPVVRLADDRRAEVVAAGSGCRARDRAAQWLRWRLGPEVVHVGGPRRRRLRHRNRLSEPSISVSGMFEDDYVTLLCLFWCGGRRPTFRFSSCECVAKCRLRARSLAWPLNAAAPAAVHLPGGAHPPPR